MTVPFDSRLTCFHLPRTLPMSNSRKQRIDQPINPMSANLMRSVMARPLLEGIQRELAFSADTRNRHPKLSLRNGRAIFINPKYPGGIDAARNAIFTMLDAFYKSEAEHGRKRRKTKLEIAGDKDDMLAGALEPQVVNYLLGMNESLSSPILQVWPSRWDVIIDINLKFRELRKYEGEMPGQIAFREQYDNPFNADPRLAAKQAIIQYIELAKERCKTNDPLQRVDRFKTDLSNQYVFACLEGRVLLELIKIDKSRGDEFAHMAERDLQNLAERERAAGQRPVDTDNAIEQPDARLYRSIHQIWPDFDLHNFTHRSVRTVKADAAQNSFSAHGEGITWAVIDSGIDWQHPHFAMHANIDRTSPFHRDFTRDTDGSSLSALTDEKGHGTHVAGIIAGQQLKAVEPPLAPAQPYEAAWRLKAVERERDDASTDDDTYVRVSSKSLAAIGGIAPKCKLVSLKVLDEFGHGKASSVIAAIAHIQLINGHGRDLKIHGINLSLGHNFDAKWFACGFSPLCVEVNRLVKSGVVVVVAAGNTGYGVLKSMEGDRNSGLDLSINDPGNAELAITVGATHRDSPHMYGVSYFSSKGPTGDGRCKPDLIAPGERIVSAAAAGSEMATGFGSGERFAYCESSGTSMAAPHVSGAVAAFLSIRNEFIGEAEKVKKIFTSTATDLGRDRYFQGAGLVDLLRAIQSV